MAIDFDRLLATKFGDTSFPSSLVSLDAMLGHEVHKRYGVAGAYVETISRDPYDFKLRVPLINGLEPAKQEDWDPANLYPEVYNELLLAHADGKALPFQHPVLGSILCKLISINSAVDAEVRNGELLELAFLETLSDDEAEQGLPAQSPLSQVVSAGQRVVGALIVLPIPPPDLTTLDDALSTINGLIGRVQLAEDQIGGLLSIGDKFMNLASRAEDATLGLPEVQIAQFIIDCNSAADGCRTLATGQPTAEFGYKLTTRDMTLLSVAKLVSNSVDNVLHLNPSLAGLLVIPTNTLVQFYL